MNIEEVAKFSSDLAALLSGVGSTLLAVTAIILALDKEHRKQLITPLRLGFATAILCFVDAYLLITLSSAKGELSQIISDPHHLLNVFCSLLELCEGILITIFVAMISSVNDIVIRITDSTPAKLPSQKLWPLCVIIVGFTIYYVLDPAVPMSETLIAIIIAILTAISAVLCFRKFGCSHYRVLVGICAVFFCLFWFGYAAPGFMFVGKLRHFAWDDVAFLSFAWVSCTTLWFPSEALSATDAVAGTPANDLDPRS